MLASLRTNPRPQLLLLFALGSVLTHALGQIQPIQAAGTGSGSSSAETTSSSQPLWTYQVKPNGYLNSPGQVGGQGGGLHYGSVGSPPPPPPPSIFDAFNGLSQRQSALSGSPFLSILPIILIAAGGMLLLLPMLTMMMASPFGGGGAFGGYGGGNGPFGYPQVGALSKKRSLADQLTGGAGQLRGGNGGLIDILENVSTTIEELSRKYNAMPNKQQAAAAAQKRSKSLLNEMDSAAPANHKPAPSSPSNMVDENNTTGNNNIANGLTSATVS